MPKEILLYTSIYSYSAADIITQMEAVKGSDIVLRICSPGGEVYSAYGVIAKFKEHAKGKLVKVDGRADSGAAFLCCYAEDVECLDVSTFLFHRAAFPNWLESDLNQFTEDLKNSLNQMNDQLRAAMAGKIDEKKFKKVTGKSFDDLFSLDSRIDIVLTAEQAKEIGLVSKIVAITPEKKAEIESKVYAIAAQSVPKQAEQPAQPAPITQNSPIQNNLPMTLAEFKALHPAVFAEAYNEGVANERDRVGAFMAFVDIDPEAVAKGIEDGKPLSQKAMAELSRKALSKEKIAEIKTDGAPAVTTTETEAPKTKEEKEFEASISKVAAQTAQMLGLPAAKN